MLAESRASVATEFRLPAAPSARSMFDVRRAENTSSNMDRWLVLQRYAGAQHGSKAVSDESEARENCAGSFSLSEYVGRTAKGGRAKAAVGARPNVAFDSTRASSNRAR